MQTKKIISSLVFSLLLTGAVVSPVLATSSGDGETSRKPMEAVQKRTTLRKENALKEVDRRIASLNKLIEKINSFKRLSASQKASLVAEVQVQINSLNSLKATIEADTDARLLSEHKKTVVSDYRIYLLFLPKITIIANADKILDLADLMKTRTTNSEALSKIAEATGKAQAAIDMVLPLTPAGYPGNKSTLENARVNLRLARVALNAARPLLK